MGVSEQSNDIEAQAINVDPAAFRRVFWVIVQKSLQGTIVQLHAIVAFIREIDDGDVAVLLEITIVLLRLLFGVYTRFSTRLFPRMVRGGLGTLVMTDGVGARRSSADGGIDRKGRRKEAVPIGAGCRCRDLAGAASAGRRPSVGIDGEVRHGLELRRVGIAEARTAGFMGRGLGCEIMHDRVILAFSWDIHGLQLVNRKGRQEIAIVLCCCVSGVRATRNTRLAGWPCMAM